MADTCPVVRVVCEVCEGNPHGFKEINESDFGPDDVLFVEGAEADDDVDMTVAEIKAALDELEVAYPSNAKKADLRALLDEATNPAE